MKADKVVAMRCGRTVEGEFVGLHQLPVLFCSFGAHVEVFVGEKWWRAKEGRGVVCGGMRFIAQPKPPAVGNCSSLARLHASSPEC